MRYARAHTPAPYRAVGSQAVLVAYMVDTAMAMTTGIDSEPGRRSDWSTLSKSFDARTTPAMMAKIAIGVRTNAATSVVSASLRAVSGCWNTVVTSGWLASTVICSSTPNHVRM